MNQELQDKYHALTEELKALGSVAVAFSGGIDSTLLLKVAHDVLGEDCVAFTASSDFVPQADVARAQAFCAAEGIAHVLEDFPILDVPHVKDNPPDRCYYCKYALFKHLKASAAEKGLSYVVEGTNLDDDGDYRPGRTALQELHIISPLHDANFAKADIRALADGLGIEGADRPSGACLATRFAYGMHLTPEKLRRVEQAEAYLHGEGFREVRVRTEYETARIEVAPGEISRLLDPTIRSHAAATLKGLGFAHVSADLMGYRKGSMNEGVKGI